MPVKKLNRFTKGVRPAKHSTGGAELPLATIADLKVRAAEVKLTSAEIKAERINEAALIQKAEANAEMFNWTFDDVPAEELAACGYWEYARESDLLLNGSRYHECLLEYELLRQRLSSESDIVTLDKKFMGVMLCEDQMDKRPGTDGGQTG